MDNALFFTANMKDKQIIKANNPGSKQTLEIEFAKKAQFFDIDTIGTTQEYPNSSSFDKLKRFWYTTFRKHDYTYIEKGIKLNDEFFVRGNLT